MNKEHEKELFDVMKSHLEESRFVADNYTKMVSEIWKGFRIELKKVLEKKLKDKPYFITIDKKVNEKYSQLWIHFKNNTTPQILFGVEPFCGAGHKDGHMFVGLFDKNQSEILKHIPEENKLNKQWRHVRYIITKDDNNINFSHNFTIDKLANETSRKHYLKLIAKQIITFMEDYEKQLPPELLQLTIEAKDK